MVGGSGGYGAVDDRGSGANANVSELKKRPACHGPYTRVHRFARREGLKPQLGHNNAESTPISTMN